MKIGNLEVNKYFANNEYFSLNAIKPAHVILIGKLDEITNTIQGMVDLSQTDKEKWMEWSKLMSKVVVSKGEIENCSCGNTSFLDGFFPCNDKGRFISPSGNWEGLYKCMRCGKIYFVVPE